METPTASRNFARKSERFILTSPDIPLVKSSGLPEKSSDIPGRSPVGGFPDGECPPVPSADCVLPGDPTGSGLRGSDNPPPVAQAALFALIYPPCPSFAGFLLLRTALRAMRTRREMALDAPDIPARRSCPLAADMASGRNRLESDCRSASGRIACGAGRPPRQARIPLAAFSGETGRDRFVPSDPTLLHWVAS